MKKALFGIALAFCAINVDTTHGYSDDPLKWIMADYIDNTINLWIDECDNALKKYNETLPATERLNSNECVQLMLDGLYLKHVWRIVGGDPYFANWAAQYYANLVLSNFTSYNRISRSFTDDPQSKKTPQKSMSDEDTRNLLKNTVLALTPEDSMREKKITIYRKITGCLQFICNVLKKQGGDNEKIKLQSILLPAELINNIQANNRVLNASDPFEAEIVDEEDGVLPDPATDEPPVVEGLTSHFDDPLKWIMADYIDNTVNLYIDKCDKALKKCKFKNAKLNESNAHVNLMLKGLYLKHVWRIIGGDPYFANWAAQAFVGDITTAILSQHIILKDQLGTEISLSAPSYLKNMKSESDSDYLKTRVYEPVTLDNTVLQITNVGDLDQKRREIIRNIQRSLSLIAQFITAELVDPELKKGFLESEAAFNERKKQELSKIKEELLYALVPADLIHNIIANHRLFKTQKQVAEEARPKDGESTPVNSPALFPNPLTPDDSTRTPNRTPHPSSIRNPFSRK